MIELQIGQVAGLVFVCLIHNVDDHDYDKIPLIEYYYLWQLWLNNGRLQYYRTLTMSARLLSPRGIWQLYPKLCYMERILWCWSDSHWCFDYPVSSYWTPQRISSLNIGYCTIQTNVSTNQFLHYLLWGFQFAEKGSGIYFLWQYFFL